MLPKNPGPVAAERRMDLASLFCMIGRHGPAVALAVIAIVSVLAGLIFYRSVWGKRRKAKGAAAAAESSARSPGDDRDASPIGTDEEREHSLEESTDASDEGSPFVKEDDDLIPAGLKIRHRHARVEEKPPLYSPPPPSAPITDTWAEDCSTEADAEEAIESPPEHSYFTTAMVAKDGIEDHHSLPEDAVTDAAVECLKPGWIDNESHEEEDKVLQAKYEEDQNKVRTEDVVSQEGKNHECVSNRSVCLEQDLHMSDSVDDYKLQESGQTSDANCKLEQPTIEIEGDRSSVKSSEGEENQFFHEQDSSISENGNDNKLQNIGNKPDTNSILEEPVIQTEEVVSAEEMSQEEENLQCVSNSPLCLDQEPHIKEIGSDHKLQDDETTRGTKNTLKEQIIQVEENVSERKVSREEENLTHAPEGLVSCSQDPPPNETENDDKAQDSGNTPDANNVEEPVIKIEEGVSDGKTNQGECLKQDSQMSGNDHKLRDGPTTPDTSGKLEEPIIESEHVPVSHICSSKSSEFEEMSLPPDCTDSSNDYGNKQQSQEKEMETEEEEKQQVCSDGQVIVHESGNSALEQETNPPSSQQDFCDVTNDLVPSSQNGEHSQTSEVIEEIRDEENLNIVTEVNIHPPQTDEQELQDEQNEEKCSTCGQEDNGFEGEMLSYGIDKCQSGAIDSTVSCANQSESEKVSHDVKTDTKVETFDIVYDEQPESEVKDEMTPVLNDMDPNTLSSDGPSLQKEPASEKNEMVKVVELEKESFKHLVTSCYKDQQGDGTESREKVDETVNSLNDASVCDATSTEISHPGKLSSCHDRQSDQKQEEATFLEFTSGAAGSQIQQMPSLSFEQSQLTRSLSGLGVESDISSMTVSPDSQDALDEFLITPESVLPSAMDYSAHSEQQAQAQSCIFPDDAAASFNNEETVGLTSESCSLNLSDIRCQDSAMDSSFTVNEDIFGTDVEDAYHSTVVQSLTQIAACTTSSTNEKKDEAEIAGPALLVENKEQKEETDEKEEEAYERTEISIMEATMDNNEWITEGNYQVLPWMNPSTISFMQIPTPTDPTHNEEHIHHSTIEDVTNLDTGVGQVNTPTDESAENSKKVLAVQPMPQNVNVIFRIHYLTHSPNQVVAITGDNEELGNWKEFIPLHRDKDGHWSTVVSLPAESNVEWKFVVLEKGEACRWEECSNRLLDTGAGDDLIVHKWWGFL